MKNIVLIGMPSSGKTTIGEPLSIQLKMGFIDTDKIISSNEKRQLRDIVIEDGLEKFLSIQEKAILELQLENHVISTGGSVIYNSAAMAHLKEHGMIFYLKLGLFDIENRIITNRRFARNKDMSFKDLYNERSPLYEKYSDIVIDCSNKDVLTIVNEIKDVYEKKVKREMV